MDRAIILVILEILISLAGYYILFLAFKNLNKFTAEWFDKNVLKKNSKDHTDTYIVNTFHIFPTIVEEQIKAIAVKFYSLKASEPINIGILLHGAPGVGKSTFARRLAADLNLPFHEINAGTIINKYYGESARLFYNRVEKIADSVDKKGYAVLFIDEADCLLNPRRTGNTEWRDPSADLVNVFLQNYDEGKKWRKNLLFIIATNFPDNIDSGVKRGGRIDFHIELKYQDRQTLERLLFFYLEKENFDLTTLSLSLKNRWIGYLQSKPERSTPAFIKTMIERMKPLPPTIAPSLSYHELISAYRNTSHKIIDRATTTDTSNKPFAINKQYLDNLFDDSSVAEELSSDATSATSDREMLNEMIGFYKKNKILFQSLTQSFAELSPSIHRRNHI